MTNYADELLELLSSGFTKSKRSNLYRLLQIFETRLQLVEDTAHSIIPTRFLESATDKSLDLLLQTYNMERLDGESDAEFKQRFSVILSQVHGCGTVADIKEFLSIYLNLPVTDIEVVENPPGFTSPCFTLEFLAPPGNPFSIAVLEDNVNMIKVWGVKFLVNEMIYWLVPSVVEVFLDPPTVLGIDADPFGFGVSLFGEDPFGGISTEVCVSESTVIPI